MLTETIMIINILAAANLQRMTKKRRYLFIYNEHNKRQNRPVTSEDANYGNVRWVKKIIVVAIIMTKHDLRGFKQYIQIYYAKKQLVKITKHFVSQEKTGTR